MQRDTSTSGDGAAVRGVALWVIVGAGLLYGIVNTASQVVDLFSG
jgi:hypothetical protein